jgi:hypothetical protein
MLGLLRARLRMSLAASRTVCAYLHAMPHQLAASALSLGCVAIALRRADRFDAACFCDPCLALPLAA